MKLLEEILSGQVSEEEAIKVLIDISKPPISLSVFSELHRALSKLMTKVDLSEFNTIDLCGTGGDGKNTFNISTTAAFVVAGAGINVAKHGNYSASSICGSSNVLEELGIKFSSDQNQLQKQLEKSGICVLHAPLFHPALKKVAPLRKKIGKRTIFNLLGPLLNPASPKKQLIGVSSSEIAELYRNFLKEDDIEFSIVYSKDGYDEISLTDDYVVITNNQKEIITLTEKFISSELNGGSTSSENAKILLSVLNCQESKAKTDVVIINAAHAIKTASQNKSLDDAIQMARESLFSKRALNALEVLRSL